MSRKTIFFLAGLAVLACGLIGLGGLILINQLEGTSKPTPIPLVFPTRLSDNSSPQPEATSGNSSVAPTPGAEAGQIVYVCQMFRVQDTEQICIMNADGSRQRRLTTSDTVRHYYPSLAPDGQSVLFSSNMDGKFQLYELKLTGELNNLGQTGIAPEASPDGRQIVFVQGNGTNDTVWVMDRDGQNPRQVYGNGWDPTWSPDGTKILFASLVDGLTQLMTINLDGSDLRQVSNLPLIRGRSDWSEDGQYIVTYSGRPWERELFIMSADGSNVRQLTPVGGNSQGPSFSPDSQWVVFTAYFDQFRKANGCEIYKIRVDGTDLTRLTSNDYCDYQPRWGP